MAKEPESSEEDFYLKKAMEYREQELEEPASGVYDEGAIERLARIEREEEIFSLEERFKTPFVSPRLAYKLAKAKRDKELSGREAVNAEYFK
jgi:hypothetical protein